MGMSVRVKRTLWTAHDFMRNSSEVIKWLNNTKSNLKILCTSEQSSGGTKDWFLLGCDH